jgi:hypothetical protein
VSESDLFLHPAKSHIRQIDEKQWEKRIWLSLMRVVCCCDRLKIMKGMEAQ